MTYRRRVDATHGEVVQALRQCGWTVADTHAFPGFVDCLAHRGGKLWLVEIKGARGKLKPSQQRLIDAGFPVVVLRNAAEAAALR